MENAEIKREHSFTFNERNVAVMVDGSSNGQTQPGW